MNVQLSSYLRLLPSRSTLSPSANGALPGPAFVAHPARQKGNFRKRLQAALIYYLIDFLLFFSYCLHMLLFSYQFDRIICQGRSTHGKTRVAGRVATDQTGSKESDDYPFLWSGGAVQNAERALPMRRSAIDQENEIHSGGIRQCLRPKNSLFWNAF